MNSAAVYNEDGINIMTGQGRFQDGRATVEYHKDGAYMSQQATNSGEN